MWEFNLCVKEYNLMQKENQKKEISKAWHIANFTGAAFAGKLKKLSHYLDDTAAEKAPIISKEEFDRKLKEAERGGIRNVVV